MRLGFKVAVVLGWVFFANMPSAYAMHIAEGMLTFRWCSFWWFVAIPFIGAGFYHIQKIKRQRPLYLPLISTTAAAVFIFSMLPLPVPIAGTTSHPVATGLSALLLGGLSTVVVSFISLLIQAVFLGHGGLTTLGANVFSMGIISPGIALVVFYFLKKAKASLGVRVFAAAFFSDLFAFVVTSGQLASALVGAIQMKDVFIKFILLFLPVQLPIAVIEGLVTSGIIKYISMHRPDIVEHLI